MGFKAEGDRGRPQLRGCVVPMQPPTPRKVTEAQETEQAAGESQGGPPSHATQALLRTPAVGRYLAPVCILAEYTGIFFILVHFSKH